MLSDSERLAWIKLARAKNIGPVTFAALIEKCGSAAAAIHDYPRLSKKSSADAALPLDDEIHQEIAALTRLGGRIIASCEKDYPAGLAVLEAPPPLISVIGNFDLLNREMVAIVGARNASGLGRKFARTLALELAEAGYVVVSGLARGIDTAAHEGALDNGTAAVLAGGADNIYPPENAALYNQIKQKGLIVSEMPLEQVPQARHFPRRNRIISGLSRGVIVVEASEGSGSLITANYALEQNREVFAVPGSPLDPRARGANRLLKQGATLVESAEDVLAVLQPIVGRPQVARDVPAIEVPIRSYVEPFQLRARIEEALSPAPMEIDELVRLSGATPESVRTTLLELELEAAITRHPGNRVSRT